MSEPLDTWVFTYRFNDGSGTLTVPIEATDRVEAILTAEAKRMPHWTLISVRESPERGTP